MSNTPFSFIEYTSSQTTEHFWGDFKMPLKNVFSINSIVLWHILCCASLVNMIPPGIKQQKIFADHQFIRLRYFNRSEK